MISYLSKPRRPSYYHALMFKILCVAAIAGLFWSSAPARQMTADALGSAADFIEPKAQTPGQQIDAFMNQFSN